jgi:hypothetical protein
MDDFTTILVTSFPQQERNFRDLPSKDPGHLPSATDNTHLILTDALMCGAFLRDSLDRCYRYCHWGCRSRPRQRVGTCAHRRRLAPCYFHSLPEILAQFYFAGGLKLVSDAWVLLAQDVVAAEPADTALHRNFSFGIFRLVLACGAGVIILCSEKTAGKQQNKQELSHRSFSSHRMRKQFSVRIITPRFDLWGKQEF